MVASILCTGTAVCQLFIFNKRILITVHAILDYCNTLFLNS